ncbi:hypothetical protein GCM10010172_14090 [Paractinoplanes ferrugineus]|uniref:MmpS family membrane protein n=1 Tax=Paractinoplanes ferrugineus TaxID=113564 RepID=A0A919IXH4_9ACTN|nr:hypothetical protein Afe05nite_18140 [Actinoplanes ferrugineus]
MTDQDPSAPPPPTPDGTSGNSAPISGQPWSTMSGDSLAPQPPGYSPGYAAIPPPADPPTAQFPPVNYAPPGYASDYGPQAYAPPAGYPAHQAGHPAPQTGYPPYGPGQPPYSPPQPPYSPPQPPPRRSNAPIIAVILAVTLLLCGGIATAGLLIGRSVKDKADEAVGGFPTSVPEVPALPTALPTGLPTTGVGEGRPVTITYEVTGDGPVSIVYIEKIGESPKRLDNQKLPWKLTTKAEIPALASVIVVRIGTSEGAVSCRALVDGKEVKSNKSGTGNFASTQCVQVVLE